MPFAVKKMAHRRALLSPFEFGGTFMSMLGRFSDVISMNVHALLDRAENPERMLTHLLRTLEEGLAAARLQAAGAIAGERRLRRELGRHRAAAQHWKEQARLALARRRED